MIQQGINQLLTTAGIFAKLSPELEEGRKIQANKEKVGTTERKLNIAQEAKARDASVDTAAEAEEYAEATQEAFDLNPTTENFDLKAKARRQADEAMAEQRITQERVMQETRERLAPQVKQKTKVRRFMDYLRGEQTSWGGTIGDLPPKLQRELAAQYDKKQRKALMDRRDEERSNKR